MPSPAQRRPEVSIVGAGVIGLSLALELHDRGIGVEVLDQSRALSGATTAAAGMLAAEDPHNPAALHALAALSASLYPDFLGSLGERTHGAVSFQTSSTVQYSSSGSPLRIAEHSIDPRQLAPALLDAVLQARIPLRENCGPLRTAETPLAVQLIDLSGVVSESPQVVHTSGAWFAQGSLVAPRKGQMLRVQLPASLPLREVHRREDVYVVPRTLGPQAGTALIGATVEDAGFDLTTHPHDLDHLRALAAELLPALGNAAAAPAVEQWAGLRPATRDGLPLIGRFRGSERQWVAAGHFRNGILLAPATARTLADLLLDQPAGVDLGPFRPSRFAAHERW